MKRFVWIIGLIFCITCTIQAKDRVIERPPFLAWSSNSIEVDKIVMSDTVTTVYIKAFYHPKYWIKIATGSFLKDNNGMLYPIRRGVGITLDKEFWMPESGEAEFQLQFPPIPENVTSLDFSTEYPQRTEYHKNQGGRHFPGGSKGCICHKRSIGISFWLD